MLRVLESVFPVRAGERKLTSILFLAETHEIDAELRTRRPKLRIQFNGLPVISNVLFIAPVEEKMVRHERITLAVNRIDRVHFCEPSVR